MYYNIDTTKGEFRFVDMDEVLERYENSDYRELEDEDFLTEDDKCPHCESENIEFMDILRGSSDILGCKDCGEAFYTWEMEDE